LLNEAFTNIQLIGCAAVLVGVYLADKARRGVSNA
jgi:drug/metabolite transporter (DMT)-like permease